MKMSSPNLVCTDLNLSRREDWLCRCTNHYITLSPEASYTPKCGYKLYYPYHVPRPDFMYLRNPQIISVASVFFNIFLRDTKHSWQRDNFMIPAIVQQCTCTTFTIALRSQSNWFKEAIVLPQVRITYGNIPTNAGQTILPVFLSTFLIQSTNTPPALEMRASMPENLSGRNVYVIIPGLSLL